LISPALYTILALMAVATTVAAPPLFGWLHRPETVRAPVGGIDALVGARSMES